MNEFCEISEEILDQISGGTGADDDIIYTVRRGDTIGKIARTYNTTVAFLADYSHIPNVDRIKAGQTIRIPRRH